MAKYVGFKIGGIHEVYPAISEYYCGGCGYPVTDHDSFCQECGGAFRERDADDLESENAKLQKAAERNADIMEALNLSLEESQAENTRLRQERDLYRELFNLTTQQYRYVQVRNENTRLREFAKLYLAAVSVDCDLCPYCDPELCDTETDPMSDGCRLCKEMLELRIEVSE